MPRQTAVRAIFVRLLLLPIAISGAIAPIAISTSAKADVTFTAICAGFANVPACIPGGPLLHDRISASITFPGNVPLDGSVFSGPALLNVSIAPEAVIGPQQTYTTQLTLPSTQTFSYTTDAFIQRLGYNGATLTFSDSLSLNLTPGSDFPYLNFAISGGAASFTAIVPTSRSIASFGVFTVPPAEPSLFLTVTPGGGSLFGPPTDITASVTLATAPPLNSVRINGLTIPAGVTTLQQAAQELHYSAFEWVQQIISIPDPSPYYQCPFHGCTQADCKIFSCPNVETSQHYIIDPPPNGLVYCSLKCDSFPFYYELEDVMNVPDHCVKHPYNAPDVCLLFLRPDEKTLSFFDAPGDPCIEIGGNPSQAFESDPLIRDLCRNRTTGSDAPISFITNFVGVKSNFDPDENEDCISLNTCDVLAFFEWTDNYNGYLGLPGEGGIIATLFSDTVIDPNTGSGGITLVSVNSVAIGEPPSATFLALASLFCWRIRIKKRNRTI